jgi:outer membrane receptor protein involved in Fe transport
LFDNQVTTQRIKIELDKLTLAENASVTFNRFSTSNANAHAQIGTLSLSPGSTLTMNGLSYITTNSPFTQNGANTRALKTLQIIGDGRNSATYEAGSGNGFQLFTKGVDIVLLDTGTYDDASPALLYFDTTGVSASLLSVSGLNMPVNSGNFFDLTLSVQNNSGESSHLQAAPTTGSTFTLIDKLGSQVSISDLSNFDPQNHVLYGGPYMDYSLDTWVDTTNPAAFSWKATWTGYNADKSAPLLEGMMAKAIALQNAGDLLTESGISNALALADPRYGQRGLGLFSSFAGYHQKFSTGSHVDYTGFGFVGGPALNYDTSRGHLLLGAFLEVGRGNYDTVNQFKIREATGPYKGKPIGGYSVHGDGDSDYLGAGLLVRHDFDPGFYAEASVRAGRISNDFSSSDMGPNVKYDIDSDYLGLHGGLGYRYEYKPGLMLDAYGKAYWTRVGGGAVVTGDGMNLEFDEAEFLRTRLGVRYTKTLTEALGLILGGAWDYNFGGDDYGVFKGRLKGTDGTLSVPIALGDEPSLKGSSGILDVGLEYKPFEDTGLSLALTGKAYLGHVEGGSGTLLLKYVFGGSDSASVRGRINNPPSSGDSSGQVGTLTGKIAGAEGGSTADAILMAQAAFGENGDGNEAGVTLETVTVYSEPVWKQVLSPGTVSVVVPDNYKGEQKSIGDLLDTVPGLHVNKRGGSGQYTTVNVRGSTSAQVGIYVDGVPQNLGGDAAVDLSLYTSENVARIEVYKGYIPVRFVGAPIGGVINIVTKKPADQSTTLSAGARSFGGFQANGLFSGPLFDGALLLSVTRDQSDGDFKYKYWQRGGLNTGLHSISPRWRWNNSHKKTDVMAKWQNEHLSLQGSWKEMDRYYPWSTQFIAGGDGMVDLIPDAWGVNRHNRQQVLERDFSLGYRNDWGDLNWGVQAEYKNQVKNFRWEDGGIIGIIPVAGEIWSKYDSDRWGVTADASYKLGEHNMLEFTGNFTREEMNMNGNDWTHADGSVRARLGNEYKQDSLYLQLQDTITVSDDLWLTLILRGYQVKSGGIDTTVSGIGGSSTPRQLANPDFNTAEGKFNSTWGVAVKKNVADWSFKATGGTFIRYPNFYELFGDGVYLRPAMYAWRTSLPVPEKGEQWDFTVEWNGQLPWLKTPGDLSVTYFTRRTNNMIGLFQTPMYVYYGNYGETRAAGVELEAGLKSTYLDLRFSATWLESEMLELTERTKAIFAGGYWVEGDEILNSPQWETNLRADFRTPWIEGLSIFAEHHYTSEVPIEYTAMSAMAQGGGLIYEESLHLVNLGLRAELTDGLLLTAGVNDVFNKAPEQGYYDTSMPHWGTSNLYFPKMGRSYYTTLQWTF